MRIIACDDDKNMMMLIKQWTQELLENQPFQFIFYENGIDLLNEMEQYEGKDSQIVFMDIKLKNDNGIGVAKILNRNYGNTAVIFISGYTEYLEDSFEADPVYFLVKPLKKEKFRRAFEKALQKITSEERKYLLVKGKDIKRVFYDEIYYAESMTRKIHLYFKDQEIEYYEKMDELEKLLQGEFVRCHKSYLVNLRYVSRVDGKKVTLIDGTEIPISRKNAKDTKEIVFEYLGRQLR